MMTPVEGLVLFLMIGFLPASFGDVHSLYYIYTIQNGTNHSAVILLDDRHIDCSEKSQTLKPDWLKNIPDSTCKTSTDMLKEDETHIRRYLNIIRNEFSNPAGVHVLQWRHGCEGEQSSDGSLTVLNSINEFGYDGEDLIQFNCTSKTWITPEKKKNRERELKWNFVQNTVRKCEQCVEILKTYLQYRTTESNQAPPAVHTFAKKSVRDSRILTCLATGFYPKHVKMSLRKFTTSFPDHLITSSGVRPNDDGTYQLRKSVEIQEDDPADFNCYVTHSSLTEPVIKKWVKPKNGPGPALIGGAAGGVIVILVILLGLVFFVLKKKGMIGGAGPQQVIYTIPQEFNAKRDAANPPRPNVLNGHGNGDANVPLLSGASNGHGNGPETGGSDSDSGRGSNSFSGSDENIPKKS